MKQHGQEVQKMGSKTLIEKLFLDSRREERVVTDGGKNAAAGEKAEGALAGGFCFHHNDMGKSSLRHGWGGTTEGTGQLELELTGGY